jgi:hypothetical protein
MAPLSRKNPTAVKMRSLALEDCPHLILRRKATGENAGAYATTMSLYRDAGTTDTQNAHEKVVDLWCRRRTCVKQSGSLARNYLELEVEVSAVFQTHCFASVFELAEKIRIEVNLPFDLLPGKDFVVSGDDVLQCESTLQVRKGLPIIARLTPSFCVRDKHHRCARGWLLVFYYRAFDPGYAGP